MVPCRGPHNRARGPKVSSGTSRWRREERPRFAVWGGRMNLRKAGGTAAQAALQASSYRGMHTTPRRDSLMVKRWLKRASETITRKAGNSNSGEDLTALHGGASTWNTADSTRI